MQRKRIEVHGLGYYGDGGMYLFLVVKVSDCIFLGLAQGVSGSNCMSMERRKRSRRRSWFRISLWVGVGFSPNALVVKAFQSVSMAADWRERSRRDCCGGRGVWDVWWRLHLCASCINHVGCVPH